MMPLSPEAIATAAELFGAPPDGWIALKRNHICPLPGRRWLLLEVFPIGTSAALMFMDGDFVDDKRTIRAEADTDALSIRALRAAADALEAK